MHSDALVSLPGHIIDDMEINAVFNLVPDSFVKIKELVSADKFISVPLFFDKGFLLILWNLKVLNLQPAAIKTSIYQMILDPSKIISRYNYKYKFSSEESFMITLNENKIPLKSGF